MSKSTLLPPTARAVDLDARKFAEMVDGCHAAAQTHLNGLGERDFLPMLICWMVRPDGMVEERAASIAGAPPRLVLPGLLRQWKPYCHVYIADAWIGKPRPVGTPVEDIPLPSTDPERTEALVIAARHPDVRVLIEQPYTRESGTLVYGEPRRKVLLPSDTTTVLWAWALDDPNATLNS